MSAIRIPQPPVLIVILCKKQRSIRRVACVRVKQAIDGTEKRLGMRQRIRRLAPQVGLQIRHQQRRRDSLSRYISNHQSESLFPQGEKIEVVSADLARLHASSGIFKSLHLGMDLWKQP